MGRRRVIESGVQASILAAAHEAPPEAARDIAIALGSIREPESERLLRALLQTADGSTVELVADALCRVGGPACLPNLVRCRGRSDLTERAEIAIDVAVDVIRDRSNLQSGGLAMLEEGTSGGLSEPAVGHVSINSDGRGRASDSRSPHQGASSDLLRPATKKKR